MTHKLSSTVEFPHTMNRPTPSPSEAGSTAERARRARKLAAARSGVPMKMMRNAAMR